VAKLQYLIKSAIERLEMAVWQMTNNQFDRDCEEFKKE
jgi:hypothetical protein